ncbi:MAG: methyltransferase [Desulfovibrio sp.]
MPAHIASQEEIRALTSAFQKSRVLLTAADLDLFTHLGRAWHRPDELAPAIHADVRALDRLLGALTALGLCSKRGNAYQATDAAHELLSTHSPKHLSLGHLSNLYSNWGSLTQAVRRGGSVLHLDFDDDSRREAFIAAMHARARAGAEDMARRLPLAGVRRALDVGGGSGAYSMAMCQAEPDLTAVVLDLPEVTALTKRYVAEAGLSDRISTLPGSFLERDWGAGYDLVFLSAIIHMLGPADCEKLVRRAFAALNPGGSLAVVDFIMDAERTSPPFGAIFALNMLVNTAEGDVYTENEVRDWLARAGFTDLRCEPIGEPGRAETSLSLGRKP